MRPSHYHSRTRDELTERQRQVLDLIARGKTNPQIADALGMTLDGAKFHVSEILAKLDVPTREEAAEWWRREHSFRAMTYRSFESLLATWRWLAVSGGALALVALAGITIAWMTSGRDTVAPQLSPTASATPPADAALAPCSMDNLTFQLAATPRSDDVQLILDVSAKGPCSFGGQANLALVTLASIPSGSGIPEVRGTYTLRKDFPSSGTLATWDWSNWCWDTSLPFRWQLNMLDPGGAPLGQPVTVDVHTFPPCRDGTAPSTLTVENATTGVNGPAIDCPDGIPTDVCSFVSNLVTTLEPDDIAALVARGLPTTYECDATNVGGGGLGGPQVCAGQVPGTSVRGFPLAMHGSEGETLSPADFTKALQDEFGKIAPRLGSMGCTVMSARCVYFVAAFATGQQPAVVYLAFQIRPGSGPVLTGAGLSGDNAATILNGGRTMSVIGETNFISVEPGS